MTTIAFYFESENYRWMANVAIASARKAMPNVIIAQLSPNGVPCLTGVDRILRITDERLLGLSFLGRYFALAPMINGDLILANCDMAFLKSVEHVFNMPGNWPITVPHIASPDVRFDGGVFFVRNDSYHARLLWDEIRRNPACALPDKPVIEQLMAFNTPLERYPFHVHTLPGALYSYVPKNEFDPATGAYIVHARGPRKKWLCHYAGLPPSLGESYLETYDRFLPKGPAR